MSCPNCAGLGRSSTAHFYGLTGRAEALAYLAHPVLGARLRWAVEMLSNHADTYSARDMLGAVDADKLRSCLTLFAAVSADPLFETALAALYDGVPGERTLTLLASTPESS